MRLTAEARWVLHVDMDAFYASVEQLEHPELRGLPVIVGGSSARGVVSTCSYEARKFGVHSAMPLYRARQLCPQGVFIPPRMQRYQYYSDKIMRIFEETSPLVEQLSIDEAFMDLSGMERRGGALALAREVQQRIQDELQLSASVGLAPNKFLAKLASDLRKPHGFVVVRPEEVQALLAPMGVDKIFGIGRKAAAKLAQYGVLTVGQLASTPLPVLAQVFGKNAAEVQQLALGVDPRPVVPEREAKSLGKETTFEEDYTDYEVLRQVLLELAQQVGWRLRRQGLAGHTVTLKVKYADFRTVTRSTSQEHHFVWDEEIFAAADALLQAVNVKPGVRLLGVTVGSLVSPDEAPELAFAEEERLARRNAAVDALKSRFGEDIIRRGTGVLRTDKQ